MMQHCIQASPKLEGPLVILWTAMMPNLMLLGNAHKAFKIGWGNINAGHPLFYVWIRSQISLPTANFRDYKKRKGDRLYFCHSLRFARTVVFQKSSC